MASDVREHGDPLGKLPLPSPILGSKRQTQNGQVPRLIDDTAPQLAGLIPAVIAGIGAEHEQQAQRHSDEFKRRDRQAGTPVVPVIAQPGQPANQAEGANPPGDKRRH